MTTTETTRLPQGQVHDVDPRALAIASNVRETVVLHPEFVASIKEHGVLEAISAFYDTEGRLAVERGQRRTLAAIKAKRDTVPVLVIPAPTDKERISRQLTENLHRDAMVAGDVTAGVEQLALLGVSDAQIARGLSIAKDQVAAARAVTRSAAARTIAEEDTSLTLEHLAGIAEFEGDGEAQEALHTAVRDGDFEHTLQRARDERTENEARDAFLDGYRAQGYTIIDPPSYSWGNTDLTQPQRLAVLGDVDDPTTHAEQCPGHAWCLGYEWANFSKETGERLTDDQAEEIRTAHHNAVAGLSANDQEGREKVQHLAIHAVADNRRVYALQPCCTNPAEHGHTARHTGYDSGTPKGPMTVAEKAERRTLIDNNKAWKSAVAVRRSWLFEFARRKTAPAGAELFVLRELLHLPAHLRGALLNYGDGAGHQSFRDVMGLDRERAQTGTSLTAELVELLATLEGTTGKRAALLTTTLVLASWHHLAGPDTWRNPTDGDRRVLGQMRDWGYPLSAVEQLVFGAEGRGEPSAVAEDDNAADLDDLDEHNE